jgi:hypothetical protein
MSEELSYPPGYYAAGITNCYFTQHEITAINGQCYVEIDRRTIPETLNIHAEALSAYRYRMAHKSQELLPSSQLNCKGPWLNVGWEKDSGYTSYWGEGCHGGSPVNTISEGANSFRGENYEFEFKFSPIRH